jgi:hypothetical protein
MVLYKHGVGYVERQGAVKGTKEIKLSFKKPYMNDLLKSLLVFSTGKGLVTGVSYETPEDISKLIAEKAIRVPEREAMIGLFRQLKGYTVDIQTNTEKVKGKVLGTQEPVQGASQQLNIDLGKEEIKPTVVIKQEDGAIKSVIVEKIVSYKIEDDEATEDLDFFLDAVTSERKKNVKAVTVFLDGKDTQLNVSYISSMPSWRVSYRLVHEKDKAMVQGWGIIDNNLDEDLKDVDISLVAGKPISFIYDLYTPPAVYRPTIREESRGVSAPVELEGEMERYEEGMFEAQMAAGEEYDYDEELDDMLMEKEMAPEPMAKVAKKKDMAYGAGGLAATRSAAAPAPPMDSAQLAASTRVATTTVEMGEFFKYDIAHPVTVKRGQSAMVPIIQTKIDCIKEHVYNAQKMPRNPLVTMRVKNDTGMVLERGPVTVVDEGTYVGEAILPYTVPLGENHIAYSVDMGVNVTEDYWTENEFKSVWIKDSYLYREEYETKTTEYSIENKNKNEVDLVLEHPKNSAYELIKTQKPTEETENFYRWKSKIKSKKQTKFKVLEGRTVSYSEYLRDMSLSTAEWYLDSKYINKLTFGKIKEIIDLRSKNQRQGRGTKSHLRGTGENKRKSQVPLGLRRGRTPEKEVRRRTGQAGTAPEGHRNGEG